jgi:hypothetical protein
VSPIPIPVPSPGEVVDWIIRGVKYLKGRGQRHLEHRWQTAQAARSHPELVSLLEEFYEFPLLRRGELAFPVAVWTCPARSSARIRFSLRSRASVQVLK